MKLKVAWIGKTKEPAIQSLTDDYVKRIGRYADIEATALKDEAALLSGGGKTSAAKTRSYLVLLDSRGKQFSSQELSQFLDDHQQRNPLPLLFAIGPADGFSEGALESANLVLSLGRMTLAHELARVVLLEQLYRAFTILKKHPYHIGH